MKLVIPDVISFQKAVDFRSQVTYLQFTDKRLFGILEHIYRVCDASTKDPAYCRVEERSEGHPWHVDKGTKGHMEWCRFSARILLNPKKDFTGGGFYFRDAPDDPIFGYRSLIIYDSTNAHFVASHKGNRHVLLMFFT